MNDKRKSISIGTPASHSIYSLRVYKLLHTLLTIEATLAAVLIPSKGNAFRAVYRHRVDVNLPISLSALFSGPRLKSHTLHLAFLPAQTPHEDHESRPGSCRCHWSSSYSSRVRLQESCYRDIWSHLRAALGIALVCT